MHLPGALAVPTARAGAGGVERVRRPPHRSTPPGASARRAGAAAASRHGSLVERRVEEDHVEAPRSLRDERARVARRASSSADARRPLRVAAMRAHRRGGCGRPRPRALAPRDSASSDSTPDAGVQAPASGGPSRSCPSQLNSVSRTRSGVGRRLRRAGKAQRRAPRWRPPMMRTRWAFVGGTGRVRARRRDR